MSNRLPAFVCLVLLSFTGAAQAAQLDRGTAAEPNTLDPQSARGNSASAILYDLFVGLTTMDANGKVIPGLAEKWEVSDDGLTYRFHLRNDIVWSDGTPITAEDFVYSGRRLVNPETAALFAAFFYPVKGARQIIRGGAAVETLGVFADDERTVRYELAAPAPYFPQILATNAAAPVPRHVIAEHARRWTRPGTMVSSGPYVLSEWVPQSYLRVEKNDKFYAADAVSIDTVVFHPTQNTATSLNRFRTGELDIVLNFPPGEIGWLRDNMTEELRISPALAIYYFLFNHRKPPFDDPRVREALSISVDRAGMIEKLVNTGVTPAHRLTPPALSEYQPPAQDWPRLPMPQRLAKARELLAAAGFSRANPLTFTLKIDSLEESRKIAIALMAMWRSIGVQASIENSDLATLNKLSRTGTYEVMRYAWFAPYDDPETFLALLESRNPNNLSGYSNPAYDALIRQARSTLDPPARRARLAEAEQIALADFPVMPLYFYAGRRLVSQRVTGWVDNPRGVHPSRFLTLD